MRIVAAAFNVEKSLIILKERNGAQGRNRTTDTVIFSHVLYQLSYLGKPADRAGLQTGA